MRQGRKLAREFQGSVDQLIKEAELEEVKNLATAAKRGRLDRELEKVIDPTGELKQAVDATAVKRELNADGTSLPAPAPTAPAQTAPAPPPALAGPAAEPTPASSVGAVAAAPKAEAEPEPATPTAPAN
jgi:sec-independent protein translocase protein TatB